MRALVVIALAAGCSNGRPTDEDLRKQFAIDRDAFESVRDAMLGEPRFGMTFWIWRGRLESRGVVWSRAPVDLVADTERPMTCTFAHARLADDWYIVDFRP